MPKKGVSKYSKGFQKTYGKIAKIKTLTSEDIQKMNNDEIRWLTQYTLKIVNSRVKHILKHKDIYSMSVDRLYKWGLNPLTHQFSIKTSTAREIKVLLSRLVVFLNKRDSTVKGAREVTQERNERYGELHKEDPNLFWKVLARVQDNNRYIYEQFDSDQIFKKLTQIYIQSESQDENFLYQELMKEIDEMYIEKRSMSNDSNSTATEPPLQIAVQQSKTGTPIGTEYSNPFKKKKQQKGGF